MDTYQDNHELRQYFRERLRHNAALQFPGDVRSKDNNRIYAGELRVGEGLFDIQKIAIHGNKDMVV